MQHNKTQTKPSAKNGARAAANTCQSAPTCACAANGTPPANPSGPPLLDVFIPGHPATQGSKRHVGNGVMIEMDKKLPAWRQAIKLVCHMKYKGVPIDYPVKVTVVFYLPRPKNPRFELPATAVDCDKNERALGDGLEQAGVLKNDARIVHWDARQEYTTGQPGAHVVVTAA
ncbi:RusA family crossover junction endodeoxyribonuclease [uncultured Corynebacterium sp.]|uniref:RusA family crossover junction endodeoxyribonuclease n=1 Tax=uncultured Corynebacterium sp. TaxID=159447 RepID=UPI00261AB157|nr:RusA family crossover junction endodeoxyribonuclease [uncultured Corynebacterium sp.]